MTEDDFRTLVLEGLHSGPDGHRSVVRDIVRAHPTEPAALLVAALRSAADEMDASIRREGSPTEESRVARRLAMMLSMEIDRIDGAGAVTLGELLAFWTDHDDFFPRL